MPIVTQYEQVRIHTWMDVRFYYAYNGLWTPVMFTSMMEWMLDLLSVENGTVCHFADLDMLFRNKLVATNVTIIEDGDLVKVLTPGPSIAKDIRIFRKDECFHMMHKDPMTSRRAVIQSGILATA